MIYSVPEIIAFCSEFTCLAPGDVIATGTPEGVGHRRNPPLWMKAGDIVEVEVSRIGKLRSRVVDEQVSAFHGRCTRGQNSVGCPADTSCLGSVGGLDIG